MNWQLHLVGGLENDDDYFNIKKLISQLNLKNKIKLIHPLPQDKLIKYYQMANVFVLPSLCEPYGKVILEAMASGVPIIATNRGGTQEIIKNKENGILVSVKNSKSIANAINNLFINVKLKNYMIKNGFKTAETHDWKNIANQYTKIF